MKKVLIVCYFVVLGVISVFAVQYAYHKKHYFDMVGWSICALGCLYGAYLFGKKHEAEYKCEALPPQDMGWQIGKTAASIDFVNSAEKFIANSKDEEKNRKLREAIEKIKRGKLMLYSFIKPEEYKS